MRLIEIQGQSYTIRICICIANRIIIIVVFNLRNPLLASILMNLRLRLLISIFLLKEILLGEALVFIFRCRAWFIIID